MDRDDRRTYREERRQYWEERKMHLMAEGSRHGHVWTGLLILIVGIAALLRVSVPELPDWIFSWQMLLITLGLFLGFRHGFRGAAWFILIFIGGAFLLRDFFPGLPFYRYFWPIALIAAGLLIILRPRRKIWEQCGRSEKNEFSRSGPQTETGRTEQSFAEENWSKEDFVDATSVFGGYKKNILSKDFKGGDIVNIFGGTELNLSQADIKGKAVIEVTTIFGGSKLIIPSNWEVKSEAVMIFGGLEDKRHFTHPSAESDKVLVIKGTVIFGGIEIKSF